jgi:hypothetical protein
MSFELIYEDILYPEYEIDFEDDCDLGCDADGEPILGEYDPDKNHICIDRALRNMAELNGRKRIFTIWHEVAHAILHRTWLRAEASRLGVKKLVETELSLEPDVESKIERQANLFAAHAAAPTWFLDYVLRETFGLRNRSLRYTAPGRYCLYVRGADLFYEVSSFGNFCALIAYHIRNRFGGLSVEALSYRVAQSRYVLDVFQRPPEPFRFRRTAPSRLAPALASANSLHASAILAGCP